MRKPETIERLYLDFDGFFASVEQQAHRALRGRPVGVVPFAGTDRTCIIAVSREAKMRGVKNVMSITEARKTCPDIVLTPQSPDLYRRAHHALVSVIESVIPVDAIKSIDELTCRLDCDGIRDPTALAERIRASIQADIGPHITTTIGFAANRQLAKMACKAGKWVNGSYGSGLMIWRPEDMPEPLYPLALSDIPGVGSNMQQRLFHAQIYTMEDLYKVEPKHMRRLWNNANGERLWYALHGYDIQADDHQERGMIGHGRVLPPESRTLAGAKEIGRLLLIKAARRLRRAHLYASGLSVRLSLNGHSWREAVELLTVNDDHAILSGLDELWNHAQMMVPAKGPIFQIGVTLYDLSPADARQVDLFYNDDAARKKWEAATRAVDALNSRYGQTVISLGPWQPPEGGYVGGKISYVRIPDQQDFW